MGEDTRCGGQRRPGPGVRYLKSGGSPFGHSPLRKRFPPIVSSNVPFLPSKPFAVGVPPDLAGVVDRRVVGGALPSVRAVLVGRVPDLEARRAARRQPRERLGDRLRRDRRPGGLERAEHQDQAVVVGRGSLGDLGARDPSCTSSGPRPGGPRIFSVAPSWLMPNALLRTWPWSHRPGHVVDVGQRDADDDPLRVVVLALRRLRQEDRREGITREDDARRAVRFELDDRLRRFVREPGDVEDVVVAAREAAVVLRS